MPNQWNWPSEDRAWVWWMDWCIVDKLAWGMPGGRSSSGFTNARWVKHQTSQGAD